MLTEHMIRAGFTAVERLTAAGDRARAVEISGRIGKLAGDCYYPGLAGKPAETGDDPVEMTPDEFELASEMADDLEAIGDHQAAWELRNDISRATVIDLANTPMGTAIENGPAVAGGHTLFFGPHKVTRTGGKFQVTLNHGEPDEDTAEYDDPDEAARAVKTGSHTAVARHLSNAYGYDPTGLAGFIDLSNAGYDRESARLAEDAAPLPRRAEDRVNAALERVSRRTFTPAGQYAVGLSNYEPGQSGATTGAPNCGASDDLGHCIERYHSAACGSAATPEIGLAMAESGVYLDRAASAHVNRGRTWDNQYGLPMDLTQHLEAATGTRLADVDGPFETGHGRREVFAAQRQARFGDPDDDDDPGFEMPASTRAMAARTAAQAGLSVTDPAGERGRARDRRSQLAEAEMRRRALAGTARWGHPDYHGETTRDRAERLRQQISAGSLRQLDEPQDGLARLSLPRYTR